MGARWPGGLFAALLLASCTSDDASLARREPETGGAGRSSSVGGAGFGGTQSVAAGAGSAGRPPEEPAGVNRLTIVHGVVDAASVRVCLRAGRGQVLRDLELPEGRASLQFGAAYVLEEIEGIDPALDDLQVLLIAGDLSLVEGAGCALAIERARSEQLLSGANRGSEAAGAGGAPFGSEAEGSGGSADGLAAPPRLRVGELPVIPAGTLSSGRSWLLVPNGCIGGPAFVTGRVDVLCGGLYTLERPTLGGVLVPLSRQTRAGALGLQVVHASIATGVVAVRSMPPPASSDAPVLLAERVGPGEIAPRSPRTDRARVIWGVGLPEWGLEVLQSQSRLYSESWESILDRGPLERVEDGKNYAVVLLGPRMDSALPGFWNPPAITIVASDPE